VDAFTKAAEAGEIPEDTLRGDPWVYPLTEGGEATYINSVHLRGLDPTDFWDLTKSGIAGRQHVMWAIGAMNKYTPGDNCGNTLKYRFYRTPSQTILDKW